MEKIITWKSPKIIAVFLVSLVALIAMLLIANQVKAPVHFEDINLELVVREKIDKPSGPIYHNEVKTIFSLDASGRNIQRLGGIESLQKLTDLNLSDNQVIDLTPLSKLRMLRVLNLRNNQISDLRSINIEKLTQPQLTSLNLRDNQINKLGPLEAFKELTYLNIHSNPIETGLEIIGELEQLETLIMRNVYIGDEYHFLENLTNLNRLNLRNTGIKDISVIGDLMAFGALQDNPQDGSQATIDLLEIYPVNDHKDPYHAVRRYWDNIGYRYPLSLPYHPSLIDSPQFSHESGFYETAFLLTLTTDEPDSRIFYTTNGSEPRLTPQLEPMPFTYEYLEPILIENQVIDDQSISNITTSVMQEYPNKDIDSIFIASVIRAIIVKSNHERSNVKTQTYFLDEQKVLNHTLPIVTITTNPEYLFDDTIGIYVPGDLYEDINPDSPWWNPANYTQRGLKWERPGHLKMFNEHGELLISQNIGIRVHGGATRWFQQKSLRLYARSEYNTQTLFQYDFFPALHNRFNDSVVDTFKTLILRNSGNDWVHSERWRSTMFRDAMSQSLLEHTSLDIQGYHPVVVFLNGEYWGIHNVRNRYDEYYFYSYYGIEPSEIIVLEGGIGSLKFGSPGGEASFINLLKLIDENYIENHFQTSNALHNQALYEYFSTWIDIDNFIKYQVSQIYFNNTDAGGSNMRFWRKDTDPSATDGSEAYGHDGKWRFMIIDTDFGFFDPQYNTMNYATTDLRAFTYLFRSFLENDHFEKQFINTFADHLNTTFREEVVINQIDFFEDLYSPEVNQHINRWGNMGGTFEAWLANVQTLRDFANLRPSFKRSHIIEYFNLPGSFELNIQTDSSRGYVSVNSIDILSGSVGISDPGNWTGIYFQNVPITITAIPNEGYKFIGWEGLDNFMLETDSPQITINSNEDINISAIFEEK